MFPLFAWVVATLTIEYQNYEILSTHPLPETNVGGSSAFGCGWALVCGQSAKENPATECNYKLSFQQDWRW